MTGKDGWAIGVDVDDLGTDINLSPSLSVYFAVVFGIGNGAATTADCELGLEISFSLALRTSDSSSFLPPFVFDVLL